MKSLLFALVVLLASGTVVFAQTGPKPSQLGSVMQQVHTTVLTVEYSRPVARGRALFGALVPWDRMWTPGANDATTFATSTDITIGGQRLAKGTYTVWAEPGAQQWVVIFNSAHPVFHLRHGDVADKDVLRLTVTPRAGSHMEALAWYFPVTDGRKAEVVFHWGTVVVPMSIEVP